LTDFGIARRWRTDNRSDTSGTPGYMGSLRQIGRILGKIRLYGLGFGFLTIIKEIYKLYYFII